MDPGLFSGLDLGQAWQRPDVDENFGARGVFLHIADESIPRDEDSGKFSATNSWALAGEVAVAY